MHAAHAKEREADRRLGASGRQSGMVAALLRQQGRAMAPRVVWTNDAALPGEKPPTKD